MFCFSILLTYGWSIYIQAIPFKRKDRGLSQRGRTRPRFSPNMDVRERVHIKLTHWFVLSSWWATVRPGPGHGPNICGFTCRLSNHSQTCPFDLLICNIFFVTYLTFFCFGLCHVISNNNYVRCPTESPSRYISLTPNKPKIALSSITINIFYSACDSY